MSEPRVEAGDRALETARKVAATLVNYFLTVGQLVTVEEKEFRKVAGDEAAALIQSAMNAQAPRAVAPVETPDDIPTHLVKWEGAQKGDDGVYREAVETRLTAEQFVRAILKPDPNNPDDDTFWLHFPNAVEEVENREFWLKHLPELLNEFAEAFRDKSEAGLRGDYNREHKWLNDAATEAGNCDLDSVGNVIRGLREDIQRLRFKLYYYPNHKGVDHQTSCSIWREDGQGHAKGFEGSMGPCNCGALANFEQNRAEAAEAEAAALRERERLLKSTVEWIAAQQDLFFAECSQAEEIIARCKDALACHVK